MTGHERFQRGWLRTSWDTCASMTRSSASCLDAASQISYSLYASYKKSPLPSTRHCTWPLSIWKRHSIVYPNVSWGRLFANSALRSGWCRSYWACMKIPEAVCVLVATWAKSSVWKCVFTKALAWAPYCSSLFWKPSSKCFVQDVPGKTCIQMTRLSSVNRWGTAREADHQKDRHPRKGTSGQHRQNQCPDIWAGSGCASEI